MKTTILATAVLLALGLNAHAELKTQFTDVGTDSTPKVEAPEKRAPDSTSQDQNAKVSVTEDGDNVIVKTTCGTGNCNKTVFLNKNNQEDVAKIKEIMAALDENNKKVATSTSDDDLKKQIQADVSKRRNSRKNLRDSEQSSEKDIREELASLISSECGIDEDKILSNRSNQLNMNSMLTQTRFAGLSIPQRSQDSNSSDNYKSDAECSANALKEYMDDHEATDISDLKGQLEDLNSKLKDLRDMKDDYRHDLRMASSTAEKNRIQRKIEIVNNEMEQLTKGDMADLKKQINDAKRAESAYDKATTKVAKQLVINPAISDLATRQYFTQDDFYLHDLATTTPEGFDGVRKAAAQGILSVYQKQAQTYLAYSELANKTNDPQQKLQLQQAALYYQKAAMNYNSLMNNQQFKMELASDAQQAGLNPNSVLADIYGTYTPAANQIASYLSTTSLNTSTANNQTLPSTLQVVQNSDGTYTTVITGQQNQPQVGTTTRGTRVGVGAPPPQSNQISGSIPRPAQTSGTLTPKYLNNKGVNLNPVGGVQQQFMPQQQVIQPLPTNISVGRQ